MKDFLRLGMGLGAAFLLSCTALTGVAQAATVGCGAVITQSITLDGDVGPCPGNGITVDADNITLDLGGHTIFASASPSSTSRVGITVNFHGGVQVKNGTVTGFDTGVHVLFREDNVVERLQVRDNACHGVFMSGGVRSVVRGNVMTGNGCAGITVTGLSSGSVERNQIGQNSGHGVALLRGGLNSRTTQNTVRANSIVGNGGDGVFVGSFASGNAVVGNHIASNGENGVRLNVFSFDMCCTLVQGNTIVGNAANGVVIDANRPIGVPARLNHQILGNGASGNTVFDLADLNPDCDDNTWAGNQFGTRNQPCIN